MKALAIVEDLEILEQRSSSFVSGALRPLVFYLDGQSAACVAQCQGMSWCRRELCWNCLGEVSGGVMVIGSGGEVNHCLLCRLLGQALPSVDLAHGDLS